MSRFQLAQLNVGVTLGPMDSPVMAEFVANLDPINALADAAPGFVWRLQTEDGNATSISPLGDNMIVNLSVWDDLASLNRYVYKSAHVDIVKRRKERFARMEESYVALWWVARGHRPSVDEALERLAHLRTHGPSEHAFSFRQPYPAPDTPAASAPGWLGDACPAE